MHTKVRLLASGAVLLAVALSTSAHAQTAKPAVAAAAKAAAFLLSRLCSLITSARSPMGVDLSESFDSAAGPAADQQTCQH